MLLLGSHVAKTVFSILFPQLSYVRMAIEKKLELELAASICPMINKYELLVKDYILKSLPPTNGGTSFHKL